VQSILDSLYGLYCDGTSDAPAPRAAAAGE
jgi:hypothetical protein